jgi:uncharacterized membrane protein YdbT with pleckstrin-like domain
MDQADPTHLARAAVDTPVGNPTAVRETQVLWSASEGQISNAGVYLVAILTFWLVLPILYAGFRYLRTARHRFTLTDQRFVEESGILVKHVESVELYRIKDISVQGTLLQSIFGRGQIVIQSTDATCPTLLVNAVANPVVVSELVRNAVEVRRTERGVRAFDF